MATEQSCVCATCSCHVLLHTLSTAGHNHSSEMPAISKQATSECIPIEPASGSRGALADPLLGKAQGAKLELTNDVNPGRRRVLTLRDLKPDQELAARTWLLQGYGREPRKIHGTTMRRHVMTACHKSHILLHTSVRMALVCPSAAQAEGA